MLTRFSEEVDTTKIVRLTAEAEQSYPKLAGKFEMHHVFPKFLGCPRNGKLVRLPAPYHQLITNEFRTLTSNYKDFSRSAEGLMNEVYSQVPTTTVMMLIDPELTKLKALLHGRKSAVKVRDANADRQQHISSLFERSVYTVRLTFAYFGRKAHILVSEELGCISISGNFNVARFTVNAKDRSGFGSASIGHVRIGPDLLEVFTENGQLASSQSTILGSVELADLITRHQFRIGEALHVYRNCIVLYVRRGDISSELVFLLNGVANIVLAGSGISDFIELPPEFSKLEAIAQEWALGDDAERSDKIEGATKYTLNTMLAIVEPQLEAIHSYLRKSCDNPPSAACAALARLAETAIEAKISLFRRDA